ncbi:MAG: AzlD domain-containing protein [Bacillota bacterium]
MRAQVLLVILGMAVVTYLPRALPMTVLSRMKLPEAFRRWLGFVPVAVLAALLGPALLLPSGGWQPVRENLPLLASLPAFWVAGKTRDLLGTVLTGLATMALLVALRRLGVG